MDNQRLKTPLGVVTFTIHFFGRRTGHQKHHFIVRFGVEMPPFLYFEPFSMFSGVM